MRNLKAHETRIKSDVIPEKLEGLIGKTVQVSMLFCMFKGKLIRHCDDFSVVITGEANTVASVTFRPENVTDLVLAAFPGFSASINL